MAPLESKTLRTVILCQQVVLMALENIFLILAPHHLNHVEQVKIVIFLLLSLCFIIVYIIAVFS